MGYPGDNDQPPWDSTPPETDPWSRHPLSAPVPQQPSEDQEAAPSSWNDAEAGSAGWAADPQSGRAGSWLESAAAPPQPPAAPEWAESQPSWGDDPLSAPASFSGHGTGAQPSLPEAPAPSGWPESPLDGPSGPQATPWEDASQQQPPYEPPTGTHALPVYDSPSYDQHGYQDVSQPSAGAFDAPGGALSAQPYETHGGTQAFPPYESPSYESSPYEAPEGAPASQPFTGAQSLSPQATWQDQPFDQQPYEQSQSYEQSQAYEQPYDQQQSYEQQPYDQQQPYEQPHSFEQQPYDGRSGPQPMPQFDQPGRPPHDGYTGPQQAAPWQQGGDGFGPGEQWPADGVPPGLTEEGKGGSNRKPLIFGGVLITAVALVAGFLMLNGKDETGRPASNTSDTPTAGGTPSANDGPTAAAQPTAPAAEGGLLESRKSDPRPLTLGEVFRKKRFTEDGITYVMTVRKKSSCKDAVNGTALRSSLAKGKCTQFLRATFTTAGGKMIGTVGVANLATASAASKAAKAATAKDAYVVAVPAKGVTSKIGQGDALGAAWTRGHYLIMTWVQLPNGKTIPAKFKKAAQTFAQSTVVGSNLGPALNIRDETGKPGS